MTEEREHADVVGFYLSGGGGSPGRPARRAGPAPPPGSSGAARCAPPGAGGSCAWCRRSATARGTCEQTRAGGQERVTQAEREAPGRGASTV